MKRKISIKNLMIICIAAAETISLAAVSHAATAVANVGARIVTPISVEKIEDLNFGDIVPGSSDAGAVTVKVDGDRIAYGGASLGQHGSCAAAFQVTGEEGNAFSIQLPVEDLLLSSKNGASMVASSFTSDPSGAGTLTSGKQTVKVGATLKVGANQAVGDYSGAFAITVAYN